MNSDVLSSREECRADVSRLLIDSGANEVLIDDIEALECFQGTVETFQYLQNQVFPSYQDFPANERLSVSRFTWHGLSEDTLPIIEVSFGARGLDADLINARTNCGVTLLHILAYQSVRVGENRHLLTLAQRVFQECAPFDPIICAVDNGGVTALFAMIDHAIVHDIPGNLVHLTRLRTQINGLNEHLQQWLETLIAGGIDLEKYGEVERRINSTRKNECRCPACYESLHYAYPTCVGFTVGPLPTDWNFFFAEPTDCFAGKFWNMIEQSNQEYCQDLAVPGSWVGD
jgi:hypothetical protein